METRKDFIWDSVINEDIVVVEVEDVAKERRDYPPQENTGPYTNVDDWIPMISVHSHLNREREGRGLEKREG